jgi:hypothetical protein
MDLERAREILKERRFKFSEELSEKIDDDYFVETYQRDGELVELYFSSKRVIEVFMSNPSYNFGTDGADRWGINLTFNEKYELTEENFLYCLEIQRSPDKHTINFCKFYLEFIEWKDKELNPVLKHFELEEEPENVIEESYFPLETWFSYEGKDHLYFVLTINPLTFKVEIKFGKIGERSNNELGLLYGEPSDIIFSALEDIQNASLQPSDP